MIRENSKTGRDDGISNEILMVGEFPSPPPPNTIFLDDFWNFGNYYKDMNIPAIRVVQSIQKQHQLQPARCVGSTQRKRHTYIDGELT